MTMSRSRIRVLRKPVKVEFYTKSGRPITFKAIHTMARPIKVEFYKKRKRAKIWPDD